MYTDIKQVFTEALPKRFRASKSAHEKAVYQFVTDAGNWVVSVSEGNLEIKEGTHDNPQCLLRVSAGTLLDIVNGKESIQLAFMTGKLQVEGDLPYAIKLSHYFPSDE